MGKIFGHIVLNKNREQTYIAQNYNCKYWVEGLEASRHYLRTGTLR